MSIITATFFYTDHIAFSPAGFSETRCLKSQTSTLPAALVAARTLGTKRLPMLATGISLDYIRVSRSDIVSDSKVEIGIPPLATGTAPIPLGPGETLPPGSNVIFPFNPNFPNQAPDLTWTCVLCRGEGPADYNQRSMFTLAGVPDNLTKSYNRGIVDNTWVGFFDDYVEELKTTWGFLAQDLNGTSNPEKPIGNIVFGNPCVVNLVDHNLLSGDLVRVRGVRSVGNLGKAVNKIWQIEKIDDDSFKLLGSNIPTTVVYLAGGRVRLRKPTVVPYESIIQRRLGFRKHGRPFGSLAARHKRAAT